jgi:hypothetical protein
LVVHALPHMVQLAGSLLVSTHRPPQSVGEFDGQLDAHANDPASALAHRAASPPQALPQLPQVDAEEGSAQPPSHVRSPPAHPLPDSPSSPGPASESAPTGESAPGVTPVSTVPSPVPECVLASHPSVAQSPVEYALSPEIAAHAPSAVARAAAPTTPSSNRIVL